MLSMIVAYDKNLVIGIENRIPWVLKDDIKHFKEYTYNKIVIMGRNTYESIGRSLPNRTNIILTKDIGYYAPNCLIETDVNKLILNYPNAVVIGGGSLYRLLMPYTNTIIATEVDVSIDYITAITFPKLNVKEWFTYTISEHKADNNNQYDFVIKRFDRK